MSKDERAEKRICWLYRNGAAEIHLCEDCDNANVTDGYQLADVSPGPCACCERPSTTTLFWRPPAPAAAVTSPEQETIAILRESNGLPVAALRPVRCPFCQCLIPDCECHEWSSLHDGAPWGYVWCQWCGGDGCDQCNDTGTDWIAEDEEEA